MRLIAAFVLLLFAGLVARAENPPDQRPYLRIEAEMHTATIWRIGVSADGRLLATGSDDKTVRLWSLPDGRLLRIFRLPIGEGNDGKVFAVALSPDGRLIAAAGFMSTKGDEYVFLFDTVSGLPAGRLGPLPQVVLDLAFSPDGARLAAGLGRTGGIRLWHSNAEGRFSGEGAADRAYGDRVSGLAFSPDGALLATASYDGMIRLYRMPASGEVANLEPVRPPVAGPGGTRPFDLSYSPNGTRLAVGYDDTTAVSILDAATFAEASEGSADTGFADNGILSSVVWSVNGTTLYASGMYDDANGINHVIAWGAAGQGSPRPLGGPLNTVQDLARLPDGGVVWGASDPAFGSFGPGGAAIPGRKPVTADMRGKRSQHFHIARQGLAVRFGLKVSSEEPWSFDVERLAFEPAPEIPAGFIEPRTDTLNIDNWINAYGPNLDGRRLPTDNYDMSHSLAIAPDAQSFILGAEWWISQFDAKGQQIWRIAIPGAAWGVNLSADGSIVIAALDDGTIRWYRASDGQELLAFFVHVPDKRWIAWTPSGYYYASPGGEDLIGWHVNGKTWDDPVEFFPASRLRDRFYRPDIVQLVLRTRDEAQAVREANIRAHRTLEQESLLKSAPAVIEAVVEPRGIEARQRSLTLSYNIRTPSGRPVTRVEIRIDGRPVEPQGKPELPGQGQDGPLHAHVRIPPSDCTVSLIAWTGDQASEAADVRVVWHGPEQIEPEPESKLFAVIVGVDDYKQPGLRLNYAVADAKAMEERLKSQEGKTYGSVEIKLLTDENATERGIEDALKWLSDNVGPGDTAVLFMSGHGFTDNTQMFYFLPSDGDRFNLFSTAVKGSDLAFILGRIEGRVILLLDACESGSALDVGLTGFANDLASGENAVAMYAAASKGQRAWEVSELKQGVFTKALLTGLQGGADEYDDDLIFTDELRSWLNRQVPILSRDRQMPVMVFPRAVPDFVVAAES